MKIFNAQQIRQGDDYTIEHEPVSSIDLMERAAAACTAWLTDHFNPEIPIYIFCGAGNNGGDGLAITRLLHGRGYNALAYLAGNNRRLSADAEINCKRLEHEFASRLFAIHTIEDFPDLPRGAVIIDALFGTGLNRPLAGLTRDIVQRINKEAGNHRVVAIDIPSGLRSDASSKGDIIVHATYTLSFEMYKLAFLLPENGNYVGEVHILPIGIHPQYIEETATSYYITDAAFIQSIYRPRTPFSHKGTYGHALIAAGSYGKMGAALLSAKACLHAGAGLVTAYIPACGYAILQTAFPEAMCLCDPKDRYLSRPPDKMTTYKVLGIGPGLGQEPETAGMLRELLIRQENPLVLDADALNIIGNENLLEQIPPGSILTPHPKEFERLFGKTADDFERMALQIERSNALDIFIVLKGHYTCISTPEGICFFNPTGNPGMATGGSGDVLTGIITGLLSQGYPSFHAAALGVYLHGLAGDIASKEYGMESMTASDMITCLGQAFQKIASE